MAYCYFMLDEKVTIDVYVVLTQRTETQRLATKVWIIA